MTAQEFNMLNLDQKGEVWNTNSIFIDERIVYNKHKIVIYSVFNFYVEVFYSIKDNKIENLKALENIEDWEGYLKSIKLGFLY